MSSCSSSEPVHCADALDHRAHDLFLAEVRVAHQQIEETLLAEHFSVLVFGLGDAVGEKYQQIAWLQSRSGFRHIPQKETRPRRFHSRPAGEPRLPAPELAADARRWCSGMSRRPHRTEPRHSVENFSAEVFAYRY